MTTVECIERMLYKARVNASRKRVGMTEFEQTQLNLKVEALTQAVDCMRKCGLV